MSLLIQTSRGLSDLSAVVQKGSRKGKKRSVSARADDPIAFTEIGFGKPLTILLERVYTGEYPKTSLFNKSKDLLVTTAWKGEATTAASPRWYNWIEPKIKKARHTVRTPMATEAGTDILLALPAVDERHYTVTIDLIIDDFDSEFLKMIGSLLSSAAGIPLFAAKAPYLMAAGQLINVGANFGNRLYDSDPEASLTISLGFGRPGQTLAISGSALVVSEAFKHEAMVEYEIHPETYTLINRTSRKPYSGDHPYAVISLDGSPLNDKLKTFKPSMLSAAQLSRFLNVRENASSNADDIVSAISTFNDLKYHRMAKKLASALAKGGHSPESKQQLEEELAAAKANILTEELQIVS